MTWTSEDEDKNKDICKDLKIGPRGSSRTWTFLEDNITENSWHENQVWHKIAIQSHSRSPSNQLQAGNGMLIAYDKCCSYLQRFPSSSHLISPKMSPSTTPLSFDAPTKEPSEYPHIPYISRNWNHWATFWRWQYGSTFIRLFFAKVRFRRLRSSKDIDFGTNRNFESTYARSCESVLVIRCTVSEILQVFCTWLHPYSTVILGVSR